MSYMSAFTSQGYGQHKISIATTYPFRTAKVCVITNQYALVNEQKRKLTSQSEYGLLASPPRLPAREALLGPGSGCFAILLFRNQCSALVNEQKRKLTSQSEYGLLASPPRLPAREALLGPGSGCFAILLFRNQCSALVNEQKRKTPPRRGLTQTFVLLRTNTKALIQRYYQK